MNWLIWKEYRLQRLALAVGLFLLIVPYSFPIYGFLADNWSSRDFYSVDRHHWSDASAFSLLLSVLTMAFLGGNAIACERIDRSAEFQAYQPLSRRKLVVSKLLLPLSAAIVVGGVNLLVLGLASTRPDDFGRFSLIMIAGLCACGVAWFVSSLQDSPTYAAASGIVAPIAIFSCIPFLHWQTGIHLGVLVVSLAGVALLAGLLSFVGGTWYYLRRVEP